MNHPVGKRVIVVGSSNAGKSTLGRALAERLGVPFIELDALYWEANWTPAEREIFRERVREAIESETWVMDGNYTSQQQDVSWPAADTIVWLDLSMATVLRRCARRTWWRWRTREVLYGGSNRENFREHLMLWDSDKSLIAYIIKTHGKRRHELAPMASDARWSHISFIRLRSEAQAIRLLDSIPRRVSRADLVPEIAAARGLGVE